MTYLATLLAIADRVEALDGPCRETDEAIFRAMFPRGDFDRIPDAMRYVPTHIQSIVPRFTASIDAAMTLVPKGWHTSLVTEDRHLNSWRWELRGGYGFTTKSRSATAPLALTAAALRALAKDAQ